MNARMKFSFVFTSTLLTLMLIIGALLGKGKEKEGAYRPLSVYTEVLAHIKSDYVEEPDMKKVTRGALQGLVEHLDPLSSYLTADQYEKYIAGRANDDGGSGLSTGLVLLKQRLSYTQALAVLPGSPAEKAGIRRGDLIEALDGQSTRNMAPAYLRSVLSGKPGTTVRILVRPARRPDEPQELSLVRGEVKIPPVRHQPLEDGIGYIDMDFLDAARVDEVAQAIRDLEGEGASRLVLDLRGNALGDTTEGIRMANLFLNSGTIASLKGQRRQEETFVADKESTVTAVPLVVITDRATTGGAELVAAALLDNERGKITGERTYGLATSQETIELDDGSALVLSVAKYYRPSGKAFHDGGIEPSDPVAPAELRRYRLAEMEEAEGDEPPSSTAPPDPDKDPFLKKAIDLLKQAASPADKAA